MAKTTLGDVLYPDGVGSHERERAWVALLRLVAARDQQALHALYERTHRLVYTLILRITRSARTAEELTLQVFYDVWTNAPPYDAAKGTVLAWIMNQARARAVECLQRTPADARSQAEAADLHFAEQSRLLNEALLALTPQERKAIETAYFSDTAPAYVAARLHERSGAFRTWLRSGVTKLRQALARNP